MQIVQKVLGRSKAEAQEQAIRVLIYYYDTNQQLPGAVILYNAKSREKLRERNFFSQVHYRTYWENNLSLLINGKFNWSQSHYHDEGGKYPGGELNDRYFQLDSRFRPLSLRRYDIFLQNLFPHQWTDTLLSQMP